MNKILFLLGVAIISIEVLAFAIYLLSQQTQSFIDMFIAIVMVGGVNLAALLMILVGLFSKDNGK